MAEQDKATALARDVERARRAVATVEAKLDDGLGELRAMIASLGQSVAQLREQGGGGADEAQRPCWLEFPPDPHESVAALSDLAGWLGRVYRRYPGGDLPTCWAWHPWVIEELLALRAAHAAAYAPQAKPGLAVDWHAHQRPETAERIRHGLGTHSLDQHDATVGLPVPLADAIHRIGPAWALRGVNDPQPTPTRVELEHAVAWTAREAALTSDRRWRV